MLKPLLILGRDSVVSSGFDHKYNYIFYYNRTDKFIIALQPCTPGLLTDQTIIGSGKPAPGKKKIEDSTIKYYEGCFISPDCQSFRKIRQRFGISRFQHHEIHQ